MRSLKYQHHLELELKTNSACQTICHRQYTTYPLRLSPLFRLEGAKCNRAYIYLINTSPGLLAGDKLSLSLQLAEHTNLYLTDQAATKVHPMPEIGQKAAVNYQIVLNDYASLELVPEPVILYENSVLEQNILIKLHSTARLFLSEIILPGRLAKDEYYDFNYYWNRLKVTDLKSNLLFVDASRLLGQANRFESNKLFTALPIMGNAIAVLPDIDLQLLIAQLEDSSFNNSQTMEVAVSILPNCNGILIRALATKTLMLKNYFNYVLNCIRAMTKQSPIPYIAK
ncbi:MAG: urease accessory protein UreD [Cyanobacteria bacterium P01_G01_bin.39]